MPRPLGMVTVHATSDRHAVPQARVSGRVLLVDDERLILRALQRILQRDFEVVACGSGTEALELLTRDTAFDAILCDLMMPGVTGADVHRALHARGDGLEAHMVFLTGGACSKAADAFLASVPNPVLCKPLDAGELSARLVSFVQNRTAQAA